MPLIPYSHTHTFTIVSLLLGMQRYHFFRTDQILQILRIGRYRSNPIPAHVFFFFLCNLEFLYFSVLTRSSLFCVLNTIYYSVSQLVGQKCWVWSPKVCCETVLSGSWIIYSQRNDINKKHNSKWFSDARLLF